jgi:flagellar hook assembly protein FlgD
MPAAYGLSQNTPNPFNPTTQIRYQLPQPGEVSLTVYNALGQMVRELDRGYRPSGHHQVIWDGTDERGRPVSSGVYVYRFVAEGQTYSRRMLLLK